MRNPAILRNRPKKFIEFCYFFSVLFVLLIWLFPSIIFFPKKSIKQELIFYLLFLVLFSFFFFFFFFFFFSFFVFGFFFFFFSLFLLFLLRLDFLFCFGLRVFFFLRRRAF